jgi:hypothetical protein
MATEAWITGIGKLTDKLRPHLYYPEEWYINVPNGIPVITTFMHTNGKQGVKKLCEIVCGTNDIRDFTKHRITIDNIYETAIDLLEAGYGPDEIEDFRAAIEDDLILMFTLNI